MAATSLMTRALRGDVLPGWDVGAHQQPVAEREIGVRDAVRHLDSDVRPARAVISGDGGHRHGVERPAEDLLVAGERLAAVAVEVQVRVEGHRGSWFGLRSVRAAVGSGCRWFGLRSVLAAVASSPLFP
jgi:hypothetical protein